MSIFTSTPGILRLTLLSALSLAAPLLAADIVATDDSQNETLAPGHGASDSLVRLVREATRQFINVNNATAAGYGPAFGCVSGPQEGAMGVHYIHPTLAGNDEIDASQPEALIYEISKGRARLVGVEFIVDAEKWSKTHGPGEPPALAGQAFHYVGAPNRYAIPAFYELHVWAWRDNPKGAYVDWNTRVTCEGQ